MEAALFLLPAQDTASHTRGIGCSLSPAQDPISFSLGNCQGFLPNHTAKLDKPRYTRRRRRRHPNPPPRRFRGCLIFLEAPLDPRLDDHYVH